ncbi:MAG: LTA synthase family protein [Bacteroidales bacterium]|nr:LTA synthase family protein [Bacteroidales bacterium]
MRKKIALYVLFVLLFVLGKFLFMCYYNDLFGDYSAADWWAVLWHGLPHDLTCAGYLMALPFVVQLINIWLPGKWHRHFMRFWLRLCVALVLLDYLSDLFLYGYWGFRLDSTALVYLFDNPVEALGQAPVWVLCVSPVLLVGLWWLIQKPLCRFYPERTNGAQLRLPTVRTNVWRTVGAVLACGLLFVAIRGGVTTSTMNVGRVYFSSEMPLNQAATNPFFSFFHSVAHQKKDLSKQYRFMSDEEAAAAYAELNTPSPVSADSLAGVEVQTLSPMTMDSAMLANDTLGNTLLRNQRPNIVLLILESFSGAACTGVCADADSTILPNVNRMYREGVGFSNMFGNSFRTDRGCAAVLAAYPGQPTYSVMKDQRRSNNLSHLSKRLKEEGYDLSFTYGGDVNFTNMRGFLAAGGFEQITGDTDFPITDRLSKWGVPDHVMFNHLYDEVVAADGNQPFLKAMLTLSSHEPFDVEYHHFDDPFVNSLAYADSCIGSFIDRLKATPQWDNLLIIGVADHAFAYYPQGLQNHEVLRYRIPMFWTGGAVSQPRVIDTYGSQTDLTATLLQQMGIDHSDFPFSKDMMDPTIGHYAFYAFSDGFGLVTDSCRYIQDNAKNGQGLSGTDDPHGRAERWGKAYLQTLYDHLSLLDKNKD